MCFKCSYSLTDMVVVALLGTSYRRERLAGGFSSPMAVRLTLQVILMENFDSPPGTDMAVRFTNKPITGVLEMNFAV